MAVSGNHLLQSIDHGATDKVVGFKAYGPDRVIDTGEPALLQDEVNYQGSFASPPPLANYSVNDFLWDRGSSVWLIRRSGSTTWGTTGGPHGYAPGHLYATEEAAARHVTGTGYFALGGVVIYGQGSAQRPYVITSFTAASSESWQWDPLGDVPGGEDALSWVVQIDTEIVPELNEDAISTPRISLRTSGLIHYLAFLDWTTANLERVSTTFPWAAILGCGRVLQPASCALKPGGRNLRTAIRLPTSTLHRCSKRPPVRPPNCC